MDAVFVLVVMFSTFVQAVAGFGGPLLAMPIGILLVGVASAKPVITFSAWISGMLVALIHYKDIRWREMLRMALVMLVGVLLGTWIFKTFSLNLLLLIYAAVVFLIGLKRLLRPSSAVLPRMLQVGALGIAGLMQGLFVSGGSFLALYAVDRIPEKKEFRATVNAVWAILNTVLLATYFRDGLWNPQTFRLAAYSFLPILLAVFLAGKLAKKINQKLFLRMIYLILVVSGAVLLITNL